MNKPKIAVIVGDEKQWEATNTWLNAMGYTGWHPYPGRPGNIAGEPEGRVTTGSTDRATLERVGYAVIEFGAAREVKLNDDYTAVIGDTYTTVGGESIPNSAILEVAKAIRG